MGQLFDAKWMQTISVQFPGPQTLGINKVPQNRGAIFTEIQRTLISTTQKEEDALLNFRKVRCQLAWKKKRIRREHCATRLKPNVPAEQVVIASGVHGRF